eukprot:4948716-Alexandrium_andersonii.AAC.1
MFVVPRSAKSVERPGHLGESAAHPAKSAKRAKCLADLATSGPASTSQKPPLPGQYLASTQQKPPLPSQYLAST